MPATPSLRQFAAFAVPRADHPDGHAVLLVETCGRSRVERVFSRVEAEQVRAELDAALRAFFAGEAAAVPPEAVLAQVAAVFGFDVATLTGEARGAPVIRARHAACWVLRQRFGLSLKQVGEHLGGRDHKTVSHAIEGADERRRRDAQYRMLTDGLVTWQPEPLRGSTAPFPFRDHRSL